MDWNRFLIFWLRDKAGFDESLLRQLWQEAAGTGQPLPDILVHSQRFPPDVLNEAIRQAWASFQAQSQDPSQSLDSQRGSQSGLLHSALSGSQRHSKARATTGGVEIPGYEVLGELSRGGMGAILRARHRELDIEVAIKVILSDQPSLEERERFLLEAQALAQFTHPHIVRVREIGDVEAMPFMVLEFIKGRNLKLEMDARHKQGQLDEGWIQETFGKIATGLVACHSKELVHRDLKPLNILLEHGSDRPVIVDFGLVKRLSSGDSDLQENLTKTGQVVGTPAYLAPEMLRDNKSAAAFNKKIDVWGFGATLYYALTHRPPYEGASAFNIYKQILTKDPPPVLSLNPNCPEWLASLCQLCLRRDPILRPSMAAVEAYLKQPESVPRLRTRSWSWLGLSAVLVVLTVLGGLWFWQRDTKAPALVLDALVNRGRNTVSTQKSVVVVEGRCEDNSALESLRVLTRFGKIRKSVAVDFKGRFRFQVPLKQSQMTMALDLVVEDASGNRSELKKLVLERDTMAPQLRFESWPSRIYEKTVALSFQVNEEGCRTKIGDQLIEGSQAKIKLPLKIGKNRVECQCFDPAGNASKLHVFEIERYEVFAVGELKDFHDRAFKTLEEAATAAKDKKAVMIKLAKGRHKVTSVEILGAGLILRGAEGTGPDVVIVEISMPQGVQVKAEEVLIQGICFLSEEKGTTHGGFSSVGSQDLLVASGGCVIKNCRFESHSNTGLVIKRQDLKQALGRESDVEVISCQFRNSPKNGCFIVRGGRVRIKDCHFFGNQGSGLYCDSKGDVVIDNCSFEKNKNALIGLKEMVFRVSRSKFLNQQLCGVLIEAGCALEVRDSEFIGNGRVVNNNGNFAPAVHLLDEARLAIDNCVFRENFGTALILRCGAKGRVAGSRFLDNGSAGIMLLSDCELDIRDCLFQGNGTLRSSGTQPRAYGCGLLVEKSKAKVYETRFFKNARFGVQVQSNDPAALVTKDCAFKGNGGGPSRRESP